MDYQFYNTMEIGLYHVLLSELDMSNAPEFIKEWLGC